MGFFFFFSVWWCSQNAYRWKVELAKFGYKQGYESSTDVSTNARTQRRELSSTNLLAPTGVYFISLYFIQKYCVYRPWAYVSGPNWSFTSLYFIQISMSRPWACFYVSHKKFEFLTIWDLYLIQKFIFYGTMDICTGPNWGFTLVKKACTSSKIPFTGPNFSFTIFECTSSKLQCNSYFTFVGGDALDLTRLVSASFFF